MYKCADCGEVPHAPHRCRGYKVVTPAKGLSMPRTVEHYQANAIRDQDLILEQRDEIGRLFQRINKLEQKIMRLEGRNV